MSEEKINMQGVSNNETYLLSVVLVTGASSFMNKIQQMSPDTKPEELRKIMQIYINHLEELYRQTN